MKRWSFSPPLYARRLLFWCCMLVMLAACNLNQSPDSAESVAVSGVPVVRIISPQPNAIFRAGVSVPVQAQVTNAGADIQRVELLVDGEIARTFEGPNTAGAPAFSVTDTWTAAGPGPHSIDVIAYRADGTSSVSAPVSVTVVSEAALQSPTTRPTNTPAGSAATATTGQTGPTNTPTEAPPAATDTPSRPQLTTRQGINVRSGPGTNFNPPIGSLAANTTVDILSRNTAGDWYKIRYYNGEGWVFSGLVDVSGNVASLPSEAGPPTPLPPTPVPTIPVATPVPASTANLVAGNWRLDPAGDPVCGQTFNVFIDVANLGSTATTVSGSIRVVDVRQSDGSQQASTIGGFGIIQPGQTINAGPIPLTINTFYSEQHRLVITINPDGAVPETGSGDNVREVTYTLQKGSCP